MKPTTPGILAVALFLALAPLGACDEGSTTTPVLDATGTVRGLVWLDRNGNGTRDAFDRGIPDIRVLLRSSPGVPPAASAVSNDAGEVVLDAVPVGDYSVTVDSATVGDTLRLLRIDSADVSVTPDSSPAFTAALTYPTASAESARLLPVGTRVFIEGRALNAWSTFRDSTVHVRDSTGAIRLVRLNPVAVEAGDSVRALATTGAQSDHPVLRDATLFLLEAGLESPTPRAVSTGSAASAAGGDLAAELVRVDQAEIQDTTRNAIGERVFVVDDGSGPVDIVLDSDVSFFLAFPPGTQILGATIDVVGLLKPVESPRRWVLKPRGSSDVTINP